MIKILASFFTLLLCMTLSVPLMATPTKWVVDKNHSNITFQVTHMLVSKVQGKFKDFSGQLLTSQLGSFSDAQFSATIKVASIDTDNEKRDAHLKADDFLDAAHFSEITFKGFSIKKKKGNNYIVEGELTVRNVTKKVVFNVVYDGEGKNMLGHPILGFVAKSVIKRSDFGLSFGTIEEGLRTVSDEIEVQANFEFYKS